MIADGTVLPAAERLVSVVIPVYRGAGLLTDLVRELLDAFAELDYEFEIVFVEDGSPDESLAELRRLQDTDNRIRVVELAGNFGQHAALSAGFEHARGDYIVSMDADLQFDPRELGRLLEPLDQGADFVSGIRKGRRDPLMRRAFSRVVNRMAQSPAGTRLDDVGCPYNALTRQVADDVAAFGEMRRFLKPTVARVARKICQVEVQHRPRPGARRRSSYSPTSLIRLFMDFVSANLVDVFSWMFVFGLVSAGLSGAITVALALAAAFGRATLVPVVLLLAVTVLATAVAVLGLAGDYVQRTNRQTSGQPLYRVRRVHEPERSAQRPRSD